MGTRLWLRNLYFRSRVLYKRVAEWVVNFLSHYEVVQFNAAELAGSSPADAGLHSSCFCHL